MHFLFLPFFFFLCPFLCNSRTCFAWLDTGTHDSLSEASTFIEVIEKRQGLKVACLEEIAFKQGWINAKQLEELAKPMMKNNYGKYLLELAKR